MNKPKKVLPLCIGYFCDLGLFLTPVFSISGYSLRLTQWDWLHRSKVSFFAPVVAFFPFLQKPQGSGFIVFSVLSSLKITQKANNWFSCCLFPMRIQMSACTQCLLLSIKMYKPKFAALLLLFRVTCCLGKILMKWQREKKYKNLKPDKAHCAH